MDLHSGIWNFKLFNDKETISNYFWSDFQDLHLFINRSLTHILIMSMRHLWEMFKIEYSCMAIKWKIWLTADDAWTDQYENHE